MSREGRELAPLATPRFRALALGSCALLLTPTLGYVMGLDQGVFAYLGAELLGGHWPYLETWDHAFPGLAFLQALEILLLGKSIAAFRLFDFAWQLANLALILAIGLRVSGRAGAWLGAAAYALIYQGYGPWNTAQRESFGLLFLLLGFWLWCVAGRRRPLATALGVGVALGAAVTIKPTLAAFALAYLPLLRRPDRARLRLATAAVLGALAPLAVFVGLYALRGGLVDLYQACIAYQTQVYSERLSGGDALLAQGLERLGSLGPLPAGLALVYPPLLCFGSARRERLMLYLGYLGCVAAVVIQGTFAGYHFLPGLGVGAVLLGSAFSQTAGRALAGRRVGPRRLRVEAPLALAAALVLAAVPVYVDFASVRRVASLEFLGDPAPDALVVGTVFDFSEDVALARYLQQRTSPGDRIQVWGHESLVYYLAERSAASRFQTSNPLVTRPSDGLLTPMQQRWRLEFLRDVRLRMPRFVVVTTRDRWWWAPGELSSEELLDDFPAWKRLIEHNYISETHVGRFHVHRRREPLASP